MHEERFRPAQLRSRLGTLQIRETQVILGTPLLINKANIDSLTV
jgi:hypothetical protein